MSISIEKAQKIFQSLRQEKVLTSYLNNLSSNTFEPIPSLTKGNRARDLEMRLRELEKFTSNKVDAINRCATETSVPMDGNIENFIGYAQVPIGVAGPLRINGAYAKGDYFVPLATTEGALVASYNRGMKATAYSGGITSVCVNEGVQRSPLFGFENLKTALEFTIWVSDQKPLFEKIVKTKTRYGQLNDVLFNVEGNQVILTFEYRTAEASGQNMVTICTEEICKYIHENSPCPVDFWYVESNYSGDKKANSFSLNSVRGKKVTAECTVKKEVLESVLKTSAHSIEKYWQASTVSVIQSGSIGAQGHFANGLAALFLATGQDVACVSEASVGITRMQANDQGDLYIAVTAPNIIVGTIGGGTKFPTQQECLRMINCYGTHNSSKRFAEIIGGLLLCGELSIAAAIAEGHFTSAHQNLGRSKLKFESYE